MMVRLFVFLFIICGTPVVGASDLSIKETAATFEIYEAGERVAVFRTGSTDPVNHPARLQYLHPLVGPSGAVLTEDMPEDHLHQRGIYWAWRQIRLNGEERANSWTLDNIRFDLTRRKALVDAGGVARIESDLVWLVADGKSWLPLVEEKMVMTLAPLTAGTRALALEVSLKALKAGVELGGAPNVKGYGGISPRFAGGPAMRFTDKGGNELTPTPEPVVANGPLTLRWDEGLRSAR
jgi:hypothetical protein